MANFKQTVITKAAHNLMAKSLAGSANINFTRVATSKYDYKSFSQSKLESLTSLEDIKQYVQIDKVEKLGNASVNVITKITNAKLTEGYYVNAIGLFAMDPEEGEILYSVTVAETADYFPADNGVNCSGINLDLVTEVSNASNVNITVNYAGYATNEDIEKVNAQMNEKVNKTSIVNNCSTTEEGFVLDARQAKILKDYIDNSLIEYYSLKSAINIDSNTDLNTLLEFKNYYCLSATVAKTLVNTPWTIGGFTLKNERTTGDMSGSFLMQTITVNSASVPTIFKRIRNNGTWGDWTQIATTETPQRIAITPLNGFTLASGSKATYSKTMDNIVNINVFCNNTGSVGLNVPIFNLPTGYRSNYVIRAQGIVSVENIGILPCEIIIRTNGEVVVNGIEGGKTTYLNVQFNVNFEATE